MRVGVAVRFGGRSRDEELHLRTFNEHQKVVRCATTSTLASISRSTSFNQKNVMKCYKEFLLPGGMQIPCCAYNMSSLKPKMRPQD